MVGPFWDLCWKACIQENQRRPPLPRSTFSQTHLLASDKRGPWSNEDGSESFKTREEVPLPDESWEWSGAWQPDRDREEVDEEGWEYGKTWGEAKWKMTPSTFTLVRRRRWVRVRVQHQTTGPTVPESSDSLAREEEAEAERAELFGADVRADRTRPGAQSVSAASTAPKGKGAANAATKPVAQSSSTVANSPQGGADAGQATQRAQAQAAVGASAAHGAAHEAVQALHERGEKLSLLQQRLNGLNTQAEQFYLDAKATRQQAERNSRWM